LPSGNLSPFRASPQQLAIFKVCRKILSTIIRVNSGWWFSITGAYPPSSARRAQYKLGESTIPPENGWNIRERWHGCHVQQFQTIVLSHMGMRRAKIVRQSLPVDLLWMLST
jgi:hypothetical protein